MGTITSQDMMSCDVTFNHMTQVETGQPIVTTHHYKMTSYIRDTYVGLTASLVTSSRMVKGGVLWEV